MFLPTHKMQQTTKFLLLATTSLGIFSQTSFATDTALATAAPTAAAYAEEDVYPLSFFEQYNPQTAMDMIERLPGFTFDGGDKVRGFGGGAGNVLVNGSRPTSKTTSLKELLSRIPAAQVVRIDLIQGGVSGSEAAGQSVVANIIREQTGSSGKWRAEARRSFDGRVMPYGKFTYNSQQGAWDTMVNLFLSGDPRDHIATVLNKDANGNLISTDEETAPSHLLAGSVSVEASRAAAGGKLTLNTRYEHGEWEGTTTRFGYQEASPLASGEYDSRWYLLGRNVWHKGELGIDWARTFNNDWKMRTIGLASIVKRNNGYTLSDQDRTDNTDSFEDYRHKKKLTELIARTTYGKVRGAFLPEFGVELAKNSYTNDINKVVDGTDIALDASDVTIEELRGEAFATATYTISPKLSLTGGLTAEASKVTVSGDAAEEQSFKFLKPRLSATYSFNDDLQLTVDAERKVGQLDLSDFAASSEEEDDLVTAGNPNLQPDKTTRLSAMLYWNFSERGSIKIEPFHEWRSDILEQVILPSGGEGRGNAGSARFWGLNANLNLPLDSFVKGGLLTSKLYLEDSSFSDPILGGANRIVSAHKPGGRSKLPHTLTVEFRQDLTDLNMSWGATFQSGFTEKVFLVKEIQQLERSPELSFFVETTRFLGLKARLEVKRADTRHETRTRFFFDGDRSGQITGSQVAKRRKRPELRFQITGTF